MKRLTSLLLVLLMILSFPTLCKADITWIQDDANLLSAQDISLLESEASQFLADFNIGMVIATTPTLGGESIESFADVIYIDIYSSDYPNCIVFLLAMDESEWCVRTYDNATYVFSDEEIDLVMDDVIPLLSSENYTQAISQFLHKSYPYVETAELPLEDENPNILISIIIGIAVAGIVLLIMRRSMNTARPQSGASNYMIDGSFDLFRSHDLFLYSRTTKIRKQENSGNNSFRGSSGGSRGGRSGKF